MSVVQNADYAVAKRTVVVADILAGFAAVGGYEHRRAQTAAERAYRHDGRARVDSVFVDGLADEQAVAVHTFVGESHNDVSDYSRKLHISSNQSVIFLDTPH